MSRTNVLLTGLLIGVVVAGAWLLSVRPTGTLSPSSTATEPPEEERVHIDVAEVTVASMTDSIKAVGTLQAKESVTIRPESAGRVTQVRFESGQRVRAGAVLLTLDDAELRAQVTQAEALLEEARAGYVRMQQLSRDGNQFVSQEQIDQAASRLKSAKAEHGIYTTRLAKTTVVAPFSGYLGIRRVSPGEYVEPGQALVTLEDLEILRLDFKVPQTLLSRLSLGQSVRLVTDAYPGEEFGGTIIALSPRIDEANRAVQVQAQVPNPAGTLRPGLFVEVTVLFTQQDDARVIPEEAVIPEGTRTYVYRVVQDMAQWTLVDLGVRQRGWVQVLRGLAAGDLVATTGHHRLTDGARVTIVNHTSHRPPSPPLSSGSPVRLP